MRNPDRYPAIIDNMPEVIIPMRNKKNELDLFCIICGIYFANLKCCHQHPYDVANCHMNDLHKTNLPLRPTPESKIVKANYPVVYI